MKKLRLTAEEWEEMLKDISMKFHDNRGTIGDFEYTKADVTKFLNNTVAEDVKKPTIIISADTYTTMYELVKQSPVEIQWHMMVKKYPETNEYLVYDVLLFPQINSGASTTTDQDEFAKWQMNLISDPDFPIENLRGHGHSHVNMNVYSSGIDDAYQRDLITKVDNGDFYLFFVLNKKMEMYALLYDFEQQILFETKDMEIHLLNEYGIDIKKWCSDKIKMYCKTSQPKYRGGYYQPKSDLKLDQEDDDLIINMTEKPKGFKRRK